MIASCTDTKTAGQGLELSSQSLRRNERTEHKVSSTSFFIETMGLFEALMQYQHRLIRTKFEIMTRLCGVDILVGICRVMADEKSMKEGELT